jgi:DNA-directed RNA polymerase specialized sigma24 family protein
MGADDDRPDYLTVSLDSSPRLSAMMRSAGLSPEDELLVRRPEPPSETGAATRMRRARAENRGESRKQQASYMRSRRKTAPDLNCSAHRRYMASHPEQLERDAAYHRRQRALLKLNGIVQTSLSKGDQQILAAHLAGHSQAEIAADLGVTQQAVSLRILRAMRILREAASR